MKFGQQEVSTQVNGWRKFQLQMSFDNKVMIFQVCTIGCVWKTPFRKSGHNFVVNQGLRLIFTVTEDEA